MGRVRPTHHLKNCTVPGWCGHRYTQVDWSPNLQIWERAMDTQY
jgi:hypothetical protein